VDEGAKLEADVKDLIAKLEAKVAPLEKEMNLAYWEATNSGKQEAYDKAAAAELEIRKIFSDKEGFALLERAKASGKIKDALLSRQVALLRDAFAENQLPPETLERMVKLASEVEKLFNDHRGTIGGKPVPDNDLYEVLRREKNSKKRQLAWEAYMSKGEAVRGKLLELVKLRNEAARSLGYADFYEMRLRLQEQEPAEIQRIFDELAEKTDSPFARIMEEVRKELAKRYAVKPDALQAWHFEDPFFQEAPMVRGVDLDPFFKDKDPQKIVADFYTSIGLPPQDILEKSDLYEKPGKKPHAYCIDIDRSGDVRILANLRNNEKWTGTLLHEMGHAVYDKYFDFSLPFFLRANSHIFTTEAIAELFGRLTRNPLWLKKVLGVPEAKLAKIEKDIRFGLRLTMLVFARWTLTMVNFERELYRDPEQDLNALWWKLKARYQLQTPPAGRNAPDWAAKIHFTSSPVYYHNYMLGEMMASQLSQHIAREILKSDDPRALDLSGQAAVGQFLKEKIFAVGARLRWDDLLIQATGETLNPVHFVNQFVAE
jgi:peptidyl-dipeptidase A